MAECPICAREYKMLLKADLFEGPEARMMDATGLFWYACKDALETSAIDLKGSPSTIGRRRRIRFYDTSAGVLHCNNYRFRERLDLESMRRELTLKFRHRDRFVTLDRCMASAFEGHGIAKFEEDIKPPFISLYSYSASTAVAASARLESMIEPLRLFPDLEAQLDHCNEDDALLIVGDLSIRELVLTGGSFDFGAAAGMQAECALILWYEHEGDHSRPLLAEFSFRYKDSKEHYSGELATIALDTFEVLQTLEHWYDPALTTKTAYVYQRAAWHAAE